MQTKLTASVGFSVSSDFLMCRNIDCEYEQMYKEQSVLYSMGDLVFAQKEAGTLCNTLSHWGGPGLVE